MSDKSEEIENANRNDDFVPVSVIVASTKKGGIGINGKIPWRLAADMEFFQNRTSEAPEGKQNACCSGLLTTIGIPPKFFPLSGRTTIVLTSDKSKFPSTHKTEAVVFVASYDELAIWYQKNKDTVGKLFICGGAKIYEDFLSETPPKGFIVEEIYHSLIPKEYECDRFVKQLECPSEDLMPTLFPGFDHKVLGVTFPKEAVTAAQKLDSDYELIFSHYRRATKQ